MFSVQSSNNHTMFNSISNHLHSYNVETRSDPAPSIWLVWHRNFDLRKSHLYVKLSYKWYIETATIALSIIIVRQHIGVWAISNFCPCIYPINKELYYSPFSIQPPLHFDKWNSIKAFIQVVAICVTLNLIRVQI